MGQVVVHITHKALSTELYLAEGRHQTMEYKKIVFNEYQLAFVVFTGQQPADIEDLKIIYISFDN